MRFIPAQKESVEHFLDTPVKCCDRCSSARAMDAHPNVPSGSGRGVDTPVEQPEEQSGPGVLSENVVENPGIEKEERIEVGPIRYTAKPVGERECIIYFDGRANLTP